jgi:hypothetical protein
MNSNHKAKGILLTEVYSRVPSKYEEGGEENE